MEEQETNLEKLGKGQVPKAPLWFSILFYGSSILLIIGAGFYFGITASAILLLVLSASFSGYLVEAYTTDFEIGSFAKSIAMAMEKGVKYLFLFFSLKISYPRSCCNVEVCNSVLLLI